MLPSGGVRLGLPASDNVAYAVASHRERRFALLVAIGLVILAVSIAPIGHVAAPESTAFLPAVTSTTILAMALTASLLFAQYRAGGFAPLAVLSLAYAAAATLQLFYLLTFPRIFSQSGLLGAGSQSAAWLHVFWHVTFCSIVVLYLVIERGGLACVPHFTLRRATLCVGAIVMALAAIATLGHDALPRIHDGVRSTPLYYAVVAPAMLGAISLANVFLIVTTRLRVRCHLWLSVVLLALLVETIMQVFLSGGRYSVGWYFARVESGVAAATFLMMLQMQYTSILRRVMLSNASLEERNALVEAFITLQDDMTAALPSRTRLIDVILRFAQRQTHADGCVMEMLDDRDIVYEAATGMLAPYVGTRLQRHGSLSGLCADSRQAIYCGDTSTDPRVDRAACERLSVASMIVVPLVLSSDTTVVLKVSSQNRFAFGPADVSALQLTVTHLLSGLQAAQEFTAIAAAEREQRLYARQLRALHAIASNIGAHREQLVEDALLLGLEQLDLDWAYLGVIDETRGELLIERSVGRNGTLVVDAGTRIPLAATVVGKATESKDVLIVQDVRTLSEPPPYDGCVSYIAVPLYVAGARYGAIGFTSRELREQPFSEANAEFLAVVGELIATAIERALKNQQLADGEARYHALADAIPQLVWIVDAASRLEYVNARWSTYTGLTVEQSATVSGRLAVDPQYVDILDAQRDVLPPAEFESETQLRRYDGTYRWHLVRAVPFYVSAADIGKWIVTATDIEERKAAEQVVADLNVAAMAATEAKSRFLATMSHEIRTPMNGVIGMTELLLLTSLTPEQREYAKVVDDSGQSLLRLLNDILDHSKIEAGKMELETVAFRPSHQIQSVVRLMNSQFELKGITLTTAIDAHVPESVLGDPLRLRQILMNLIGNALKFTPSGGTVRVAVTIEGGGDDALVPIRFQIDDSGIGIPPHVVERLFVAFAQGDESTTRKYGGTGLGLSISAQLVALMHGTIGVESVPGVGSSFWFSIPFSAVARSERPPERTVPQPDDAALEAPRHDRILVVEDNETNTRLAVAQFKKLGFDVSVAINGKRALEAVQREKFDLVFMDCHMPEMDGFAATTEIRRLENGTSQRLPIVAMTADARHEDQALCLSIGMDDYVSKPTSLSSLRAVLERWLPHGS